MDEVRSWKHVFKLDPNKELNDKALESICESGTDAVIVGGSDGITLDNTLQMLAEIRRFSVPCALEISNPNAITPGFDYYLIPTVLNSKDPDWIIGQHHQAVKEMADLVNWDEVIAEGYCILNKDAKAAKLTNARTELDEDDVRAYAILCEELFRLPVFYLEYSGIYGDPDLVKSIGSVLEKTQLFYGGGISSREQAEEMARHADTVVVGNVIYEDLKKALRTVKAVKKHS